MREKGFQVPVDGIASSQKGLVHRIPMISRLQWVYVSLLSVVEEMYVSG